MTHPCALAEGEKWSALVDGDLSAAELNELQQHSSSCADCTEYVARLQSVVDLARTSSGVAPPPGIWLSLRAQIESERGDNSKRRGTQSAKWRTRRILAVAASMLIVASAGFVLRNGRQNSVPESLVDRSASDALRRSLITLDAAIAEASAELAKSPDDPYLNRMLASAKEARAASIANAGAVLRRPK